MPTSGERWSPFWRRLCCCKLQASSFSIFRKYESLVSDEHNQLSTLRTSHDVIFIFCAVERQPIWRTDCCVWICFSRQTEETELFSGECISSVSPAGEDITLICFSVNPVGSYPWSVMKSNEQTSESTVSNAQEIFYVPCDISCWALRICQSEFPMWINRIFQIFGREDFFGVLLWWLWMLLNCVFLHFKTVCSCKFYSNKEDFLFWAYTVKMLGVLNFF